MRKINLLFLFLLSCPAFLSAQTLFYDNFTELEIKACPFDKDKLVQWPKGWEIYQTKDGLRNGEIDSSRCITVLKENILGGIIIDLKQLNTSEPLFLRVNEDYLKAQIAWNPILLPNWLYTLTLCSDFGNDTLLSKKGVNCPDHLCSGGFVDVEIPDSTGMGKTARTHTGQMSDGFFALNCGYGIHCCFPTEKFDTQTVKSLTMKWTFPDSLDLTGKKLYIHSAHVESLFQVGHVTEIIAHPWNINPAGEYDVYVYEASSLPTERSHLALYTAPTYPIGHHPSYVEARPEPNTPESKTINFIVPEFMSLEFQPYAHLRGALTEGSDSLRHNVHLINNGSMCFNFLDVVFKDGNAYKHGPTGQVEFHHAMSCMQFRKGGVFEIMENAVMHYGDKGAGMLILCAESVPVLHRNSTLYIDGTLLLSECNDALPPSRVDLDLPPGSSLIFTKNATIHNDYSKNQAMKLNVRMLGGRLDDSALSPEDRAKIERIYPEAAPKMRDNIRLSPNPFYGKGILEYTASTDETVGLTWYDQAGRAILQRDYFAFKGLNEWAVEGPEAAGCYFLEAAGIQGKAVLKIIKL